MSEEAGPDSVVLSEASDDAENEHGDMPFRLRDFSPLFSFSTLHELLGHWIEFSVKSNFKASSPSMNGGESTGLQWHWVL